MVTAIVDSHAPTYLRSMRHLQSERLKPWSGLTSTLRAHVGPALSSTLDAFPPIPPAAAPPLCRPRPLPPQHGSTHPTALQRHTLCHLVWNPARMASMKRVAVRLDKVDELRLGVISRRRGLEELPVATLLRVLLKEKLAAEVAGQPAFAVVDGPAPSPGATVRLVATQEVSS